MGAPSASRLLPLLTLSGAAALTCEIAWMRRLALAVGSTGEAVALTLGLYMAGLGLGGAWAGRRRWVDAPAGYGRLELLVAGWTLLAPVPLSRLAERGSGELGWDLLVALALLLPPGFLHGATLPAAVAALPSRGAAGALYAANTAGAVLGALVGPFLLMPVLGLTGTERAAALMAGVAGIGALRLGRRASTSASASASASVSVSVSASVSASVALAGGVGMALEVAWSRLAALLLGGSVYALSVVLAVFLAGIAAGAALGRRWGARALRPALAALGVGALLGALSYRWLPHGVGLAYGVLGDRGLLPAGALLLALAMGAAPIASGVVFAAALDAAGARPEQVAGRVLVANTAGGVAGALLGGLVGLPLLGVQGLVALVASLAALGAAALPVEGGNIVRRLYPLLLVGGLLVLLPPWDRQLFAAGLVHRLDAFADTSPRAVERYAHAGWRLLAYEDGVTATVAVGEGDDSGVRWLSANGKVDASTGDDMPTQVWSGRLPVRIARAARPDGRVDALVVGLASGVTAGEALVEGADAVTVIEIEAAVLRASALFSDWNHDLLQDPRATIALADARAWLRRDPRRWDVLISEPSNPWITGVSNLFTQEYWELARGRLAPEGVFCQWVQLYALPPAALRGLVRTFLEVFPRAWLFETIPGADALLVAAPSLPADLPLSPTLGPEGLALLAGRARKNTDDHPWVEFEAPRWLLRSTGEVNREMIAEAAARSGGR